MNKPSEADKDNKANKANINKGNKRATKADFYRTVAGDLN